MSYYFYNFAEYQHSYTAGGQIVNTRRYSSLWHWYRMNACRNNLHGVRENSPGRVRDECGAGAGRERNNDLVTPLPPEVASWCIVAARVDADVFIFIANINIFRQYFIYCYLHSTSLSSWNKFASEPWKYRRYCDIRSRYLPSWHVNQTTKEILKYAKEQSGQSYQSRNTKLITSGNKV